MKCNRGTCKGHMQAKGYGEGAYYSCIICGNLVWKYNVKRETGEDLCKMRSAAKD